MDISENSLWNPSFSHIYIEEEIQDHPKTRKILSNFSNASVIPIPHYKDLFCRKNQQFAVQKKCQQLILAKKRDSFLYQGSEMCDNFGNEHFYYSSDAMNCIYQCEYCYLQGLYPSANLVLFVNLEDTLEVVKEHLKEKKLYICISYDTDLLAIEQMTGFVADWIAFASENPDLTIELRTKSANFSKIASFPPLPNFILAWSLSPSVITEKYEHRTPSLSARLESMAQAVEKGWKVRLCADPMIHIPEWNVVYQEFFEQICQKIPISKLNDYSVGVFRVPKESIKIMREVNPDSDLLAYPFVCSSLGWTYGENQKNEMISFMCGLMEAGRGVTSGCTSGTLPGCQYPPLESHQ